MVRVFILSGYSLFAEGIANRLRQFSDQFDVRVMDPRESGALDAIIETRPSIIMLDAADHETMNCCPLWELMAALPDLKVMRLDSQNEMIQVVSSAQFQVADAGDLKEVILMMETAEKKTRPVSILLFCYLLK